jgi:hypothetical protein
MTRDQFSLIVKHINKGKPMHLPLESSLLFHLADGRQIVGKWDYPVPDFDDLIRIHPDEIWLTTYTTVDNITAISGG